MKELYQSPQLQITTFAPVERLASDVTIDFSDLLDASGNLRPGTDASGGDLSFDIPS